jgi:hypothetical protein
LLSAIKPARDAARTRCTPSTRAANYPTGRLEQLRERSPNIKLFIIGWG